MSVGLTGVNATSTVGGIILDALTEQPIGQQATTAVGDLTIGIGVPLTGVLSTSAVGSLTTGVGYTLSGQIATSGVGAITPLPMTVGLTGLSMTSSVGTDLILQYYQDLVPNTSADYTDETPRTSASYTDKTPRTSANYTDLSA